MNDLIDFEKVVSTVTRIGLLNNQLTGWQNTYVDAKYQAQIATDIEHPQLLTEATQRMEQSLRAITWIENAITELEGDIHDSQS